MKSRARNKPGGNKHAVLKPCLPTGYTDVVFLQQVVRTVSVGCRAGGCADGGGHKEQAAVRHQVLSFRRSDSSNFRPCFLFLCAYMRSHRKVLDCSFHVHAYTERHTELQTVLL